MLFSRHLNRAADMVDCSNICATMLSNRAKWKFAKNNSLLTGWRSALTPVVQASSYKILYRRLKITAGIYFSKDVENIKIS